MTIKRNIESFIAGVPESQHEAVSEGVDAYLAKVRKQERQQEEKQHQKKRVHG